MKTNLKTPVLVSWVLVASTLASHGQFSANFDSGVPAGTAVYGSARVDAGVLKLTDALGSQNGSFIIEEIFPGLAVNRFTATLKVRVGGSTTPARPADGWSFAFGPDLPSGVFGAGEEGAGSGIRVTFDTWDNAGADTAPAIDVFVNNVGIATQSTLGVREGGRAPATAFITDPATGQPLDIRTEEAYVNVLIKLDPDGTLDVVYKGVTVFNNLQTGYVPVSGRFGLGARTGGANDNHWVDDLRIDVFTPGPPFFLTQPADTTVLEGRPATFRAAFDGTPPYALQWLRDGQPIAGANSATFTIPAAALSDAGAYSLRVDAAEGSATSRAATLTVIDDQTPPSPIRAFGGPTFTTVTIEFSEEVDPVFAGDNLNYSLSGGLSASAAAVSADRKSVTLTTDLQTENTLYTVTALGMTDLAGNVNPEASIDFRSFVSGCGGLLFEAFNTGGGNAVADLINHPTFPNSPDFRTTLSAFDTATAGGVYANNAREGYGGRIRGLFIPPRSGDWVLYLRTDDAGQLFFNPNGADPAGKVLVAQQPGCCNSLGDPNISSQNRQLNLIGGRAYYIEALYKEGTGGDYCQVGARLRGSTDPVVPIPGEYVGRFAPAGVVGDVFITQQPADHTAPECRTATFTVGAAHENSAFSFLPICYQWKLNGVDIAGATSPSYTTPLLTTADDGGKYSVTVAIMGVTRQSSEATLRVTEDTAPPVCVAAKGTRSLTNIVIVFDERLEEASAIDGFTYALPGYTIGAVKLDPSGTQVNIGVDPPLAPDTSYTVTVTGLADCSGNVLDSCSLTFRTLSIARGFSARDIYFNIPGVLVTDLLNNPAYPASPSLSDYFPLLEGPLDSYNNYGIRIAGYLLPPVSGSYNFFISSDDGSEFWLSTDELPANKVRLANEPQWNAYRDWTGTLRRNAAAPENRSTTLFPSGIPLVAGQRYYFEALMKEGGGGDNLGVAWQLPNGPVPAPGSPSISGAFIGSLADPNGAAVTITQHPQDVTVTECRTATFTVAATGMVAGNLPGPLSYRWQKDTGAGFVDLPQAANAPTFSQFVSTADNGTRLRVLVYTPGAEAVSQTATLTVAEDVQPPTLVSAARGCLDPTRVTVQFNELMDAASLGNAANYSVEGTPIVSAVVADSRTVVLTAAGAIPDTFCGKITINNVTDCGGLAVAANTQIELGIERPRREQNGELVLEAENYDALSPGSGSSPETWALRTDKGGFSGTGAMACFPDNDGTSPSPTQLGQSSQMRYCVYFTTAGTKYIWVRGASGPNGGGADSIHLGTNGAHRAALTGWGAAFGWARNIQGGLGGNTFVVAAPGPYIINIWMREDGTYVDKILIRNSSSGTAPAGFGPPESPRPGPYDPPLVAIASPTEGATIASCTTATIAANATSPCGSIVSVEFFAGDQSLGVDASFPYELSVPNVPPGTYVLKARATDNHGLSTDSAPVSVNVVYINQAPSFSIGGNVSAVEDFGPAAVTALATAISKGSTCETEQVLTFEVSNDNPGLFLVQPAIDAAGNLTFQSAANACGVANVTAVLRDNGGTENGGADISAPASFEIQVSPVNDCPIAAAQKVTCSEDGSAPIPLAIVEPDGNGCGAGALGIVLLSTPAHGTLSGTPPNLVYTPEADYCGSDTFTYVASDGQCSSEATVSIDVQCVNDPPTCLADAGPDECVLEFAGSSKQFVLALDNETGCAVLDGSAASDPENDALTHTWFLGAARVSLDPGQEPDGGGAGSGSGIVSLQGNTLTIDVSFSGLSTPTVAAHIHAAAGRGTNTGVIYPLGVPFGVTEGTISQTVTLVEGTRGFTIAQQLEQLANGLWYINIHTTGKRGGEIRGQIEPPVLRGPVVTACLPVGCHTIQLVVSDGKDTSRCPVDVCVITPAEAVDQAVALVEASDVLRKNKRPMIATLKAASASFERGNFHSAMGQLRAFQNKVRAQIAPSNSAEAAAFIKLAQDILDAIECGAVVAAEANP